MKCPNYHKVGIRLPFQEHHLRGLPIGKKRAGSARNGRCHCINLILARQAYRHSVSRFRFHTRQTYTINERLFPYRLAI